MAQLLLPHRWRRQPQFPVELAQPWAQYVRFLHLFSGPHKLGYELARKHSGFALTEEGSLTESHAVLGNRVARTAESTSSYLRMSGGASTYSVPSESGGVRAGNFALFAYCRYISGSGVVLSLRATSGTPIIAVSIGANGVGGVAGHFNPLARDDGDSLGYHTGSSVDLNDGKFHLLVFQRVTGQGLVWSVDGSASAQVNVNPGVPLGSITPNYANSCYGTDSLNTGLRTSVDVAFGGLIVGHSFDNAELRELGQNPWLLFRPLKRRIYVNAAGGGGGGTAVPVFRRHYQNLQMR